MRALGFPLRNPESLQFDRCALLTRIIPVLLDSWGFFSFPGKFHHLSGGEVHSAQAQSVHNIYVCTSKSRTAKGRRMLLGRSYCSFHRSSFHPEAQLCALWEWGSGHMFSCLCPLWFLVMCFCLPAWWQELETSHSHCLTGLCSRC